MGGSSNIPPSTHYDTFLALCFHDKCRNSFDDFPISLFMFFRKPQIFG